MVLRYMRPPRWLMSNLTLRLLTAALLIPLLIAAIEWRDPLGVWLWVFFAQVAGLREWLAMTQQDQPVTTRWFGIVLGAALAAALFWLPSDRVAVLLLCAATILVLTFYLFRFRCIEEVAARSALLLAGLLYTVVLILPLALFKQRPDGDGAGWIYLCLTASWLSDTGAYFAGRFLGPRWPRKLWTRVSPNKTVVGSLGGMVGTVSAVVVAKLWYLPRLGWVDVALIAVPANVLGQIGDLCESLIKRSVGVKDSGVLLPGHGGMLDRIDALIFVVPYVYAYATFIL
ncbi:MAG: phosphatidate cytidylyltransferase [Myxococcales bacterium]|nr:phosphatidate cytidylyltransferase [Myxococcales bacterium]